VLIAPDSVIVEFRPLRCTPLSRPFFGQHKLGWRASIGFFVLAS
jgi:hypothetical protein